MIAPAAPHTAAAAAAYKAAAALDRDAAESDTAAALANLSGSGDSALAHAAAADQFRSLARGLRAAAQSGIMTVFDDDDSAAPPEAAPRFRFEDDYIQFDPIGILAECDRDDSILSVHSLTMDD